MDNVAVMIIGINIFYGTFRYFVFLHGPKIIFSALEIAGFVDTGPMLAFAVVNQSPARLGVIRRRGIF